MSIDRFDQAEEASLQASPREWDDSAHSSSETVDHSVAPTFSHETLKSLLRIVTQLANKPLPAASAAPFISGDGSLRFPIEKERKSSVTDTRNKRHDALGHLLNSSVLSDLVEYVLRYSAVHVDNIPDIVLMADALNCWMGVSTLLSRSVDVNGDDPQVASLRQAVSNTSLRASEMMEATCATLAKILTRHSMASPKGSIRSIHVDLDALQLLASSLSFVLLPASGIDCATTHHTSWGPYLVTSWCSTDLMPFILQCLSMEPPSDAVSADREAWCRLQATLLDLSSNVVTYLKRTSCHEDVVLCCFSHLSRMAKSCDFPNASILFPIATRLHLLYDPSALKTAYAGINVSPLRAAWLRFLTTVFLAAQHDENDALRRSVKEPWVPQLIDELVSSLSGSLSMAMRKTATPLDTVPIAVTEPRSMSPQRKSMRQKATGENTSTKLVDTTLADLIHSRPDIMAEAVALLAILHGMQTLEITLGDGGVFLVGTASALSWKHFSAKNCAMNPLLPGLFAAAVTHLHQSLAASYPQVANRSGLEVLRVSDGALIDCISHRNMHVAEVPQGSIVSFLPNTLKFSQIASQSAHRLSVPSELLHDPSWGPSPAVSTSVPTVIRQNAFAVDRYRLLPSIAVVMQAPLSSLPNLRVTPRWSCAVSVGPAVQSCSSATAIVTKGSSGDVSPPHSGLDDAQTVGPTASPQQRRLQQIQQCFDDVPVAHRRHAPFADAPLVDGTHLLSAPCSRPVVFPMGSVSVAMPSYTNLEQAVAHRAVMECYAASSRAIACDTSNGSVDEGLAAVAVRENVSVSENLWCGVCALSGGCEISVWAPVLAATKTDPHHFGRDLTLVAHVKRSPQFQRSTSARGPSARAQAEPDTNAEAADIPMTSADDESNQRGEPSGEPPSLRSCDASTCVPVSEVSHLKQVLGTQQRRISELESQLQQSNEQREALVEHTARMRTELDLYQGSMVQPLREEATKLRKALMSRERELQLALAALHTVAGQNDVLARHLETMDDRARALLARVASASPNMPAPQ